ncbi:hypothetical protein HF521_002050 [Silurus meridionalis]|uniref:Uncharacterized protein n=1 Tax=Silurus meridionalis TaxID=175797 RepID=A0A8T0B4J2_SILME|nr:hypothetical protein HF521_002050 [Silurus meridionalis]
MSNGGMKLECCFNDECNGPHRAHSHGKHNNGAVALNSSLSMLLGVLMIRKEEEKRRRREKERTVKSPEALGEWRGGAVKSTAGHDRTRHERWTEGAGQLHTNRINLHYLS